MCSDQAPYKKHSWWLYVCSDSFCMLFYQYKGMQVCINKIYYARIFMHVTLRLSSDVMSVCGLMLYEYVPVPLICSLLYPWFFILTSSFLLPETTVFSELAVPEMQLHQSLDSCSSLVGYCNTEIAGLDNTAMFGLPFQDEIRREDWGRSERSWLCLSP